MDGAESAGGRRRLREAEGLIEWALADGQVLGWSRGMALWGTLDMVENQLAASDRFQVALDYLREAFAPGSEVNERIKAVPEGETRRVDLGLGVFALEQVYATKSREVGKFEAHERHIDLQAIVNGQESMEVTTADGLAVTEDALAARDVRFFADVAHASVWRVRTGEVAVFFPADVHKPSLDWGESALVHKTVVKVPVAV